MIVSVNKQNILNASIKKQKLLSSYRIRQRYTIPRFISGVVEDISPDLVILTFSKVLDSINIPVVGSFVFSGITGNPTVTNVAISGVNVNLTLSADVTNGDIISLSYTQPVNNPLQDSDGDKVVSFVNEPITNNIETPKFVTTWNTENAGSPTRTIIIPTLGAGYDCYVDWGDGGAEEHFVGAAPVISHIYAVAGIKTIKIRGAFPRIYFNNGGDRLKILSIDNWGDIVWGALGMWSAYYGCENLEANYSDTPNFSAVTDFRNAFALCAKFNGAVDDWVTSSATNLNGMFTGCTVFNQPLTGWDTSEVTNFANMFSNCTAFNQSVAGFDTGKATTLYAMFLNCTSFKQSLATFDIEDVTDMRFICTGCNINESGTTTNYDNTLISWAAQSVHANLIVPFTLCKYLSAVAERAILTNAPNSWVITDAGIGNTAIFNGDSVTYGANASDLSLRFTTLYCGFDSLGEQNIGVGSRTLMSAPIPNGNSMEEHVGDITIKTATEKYLFFAFGANDCALFPTEMARFYATYLTIIDNALSKGWGVGDIKLLTCFRPGHSDPFNVQILAAGVARGVQVIDTATALYNGGNYVPYMSDSVHPNDAGHLLMAQTIDTDIV